MNQNSSFEDSQGRNMTTQKTMTSATEDPFKCEFQPHACSKRRLKCPSECKSHTKLEHQLQDTAFQSLEGLVCCNYCPSVEEYIKGLVKKPSEAKQKSCHKLQKLDGTGKSLYSSADCPSLAENNENDSSINENKAKQSYTSAKFDCNEECLSHLMSGPCYASQQELDVSNHDEALAAESFVLTRKYLEKTKTYTHAVVHRMSKSDAQKLQQSDVCEKQSNSCQGGFVSEANNSSSLFNYTEKGSSRSENCRISGTCGHKFDD